MNRSDFGFNDVTSVVELLPEFGSLAPTAAATVAWLVMVPVAEPRIVALTEKVTVPPTATSIDSLMEPLPPAGQVPPTAAHVHVTPPRAAGITSTNVAPAASDGPALLTATV